MIKKTIIVSLIISTIALSMEEPYPPHPLSKTAAANDIDALRKELEKLKRATANGIFRLLDCKNLEVTQKIEEATLNNFETTTYAALTAAVNNQNYQASVYLLRVGPVCLHNNPEYLLHVISASHWSTNNFSESVQQKEIVELMIQNGALVTQKHPQTGKTPLETAREADIPYEVMHFLEQEFEKEELKIENFVPYTKTTCIPPYASIVSYDRIESLDDERRLEHYLMHGNVTYNPTNK